MKSVVYFGDEKLKEAFEKLKDSKVEDKMLYEWILRATRFRTKYFLRDTST